MEKNTEKIDLLNLLIFNNFDKPIIKKYLMERLREEINNLHKKRYVNG